MSHITTVRGKHPTLPAAVTQVTAALMLIVVIAASAAGMYYAMGSLGGGASRESASRLMAQLTIEEVVPLRDELKPSACYGLRVFVRNSGTDPAPLEGLVLYVERHGRVAGVLTPVGFGGGQSLPPGGTLSTLFIAGSQSIGPGEARLMLAGRFSTSDSLQLTLPCRLAPSAVMRVSLLNEQGSPAVLELGGMVLRGWTEAVGGHGGVWVKVTVESNVSLPPQSLRLELLNAGEGEGVGTGLPRVLHNSAWLNPSGEECDRDYNNEEASWERGGHHDGRHVHGSHPDEDEDHYYARGHHRHGHMEGESEEPEEREACRGGEPVLYYWAGVPEEVLPVQVLASLMDQ